MSETFPKSELENTEPDHESYERLHDTMLAAAGSIEGYGHSTCNVFTAGDYLYQVSSHPAEQQPPIVKLAMYDQTSLRNHDTARVQNYVLSPVKEGWQLLRYTTEWVLSDADAQSNSRSLITENNIDSSNYPTDVVDIVGAEEIDSLNHSVQGLMQDGQLVHREPNIHPEIMRPLGQRLHDTVKNLLEYVNIDDIHTQLAYRLAYIESDNNHVAIQAYGDFEGLNRTIEEITVYLHPTSSQELCTTGNGQIAGESIRIAYSYIDNICVVEKLQIDYDADTLQPCLDADGEFFLTAIPEPVTIGAQEQVMRAIRFLEDMYPA